MRSHSYALFSAKRTQVLLYFVLLVFRTLLVNQSLILIKFMSVHFIRERIIPAEKIVNKPIIKMEALIPNVSAMIPVSIAPIAYPKSLQSLNTPRLFARSAGCVFSATVARNVGYTIAVPQPSMVERIIKCVIVLANSKTTKANPCNSIPQKSKSFLQK